MAKSNEVKYGDTDLLSPGELDPKNAKVMISIRVDGDVLMAFKRAATTAGEGYQTLMNQALRSALGTGAREPQLAPREVELIRKAVESTIAQFTRTAGAEKKKPAKRASVKRTHPVRKKVKRA